MRGTAERATSRRRRTAVEGRSVRINREEGGSWGRIQHESLFISEDSKGIRYRRLLFARSAFPFLRVFPPRLSYACVPSCLFLEFRAIPSNYLLLVELLMAASSAVFVFLHHSPTSRS